MKRSLIFLLLLLPLSLWAEQAPRQINREQFLEVNNLLKMIQRMRDAGFTDEQIQQLDIKDGGRKINVMAYIEELRQKKEGRDAKVQAFLNKNFLTVKDLFDELSTLEPETLAKLRDELVGE